MVTHVPFFAFWYSFHESCRERPGTDGSSSIVTRQGHVVAMHADFFFRTKIINSFIKRNLEGTCVLSRSFEYGVAGVQYGVAQVCLFDRRVILIPDDAQRGGGGSQVRPLLKGAGLSEYFSHLE